MILLSPLILIQITNTQLDHETLERRYGNTNFDEELEDEIEEDFDEELKEEIEVDLEEDELDDTPTSPAIEVPTPSQSQCGASPPPLPPTRGKV